MEFCSFPPSYIPIRISVYVCIYLLCTFSIRCVADREHSKQDVRYTAMDEAECLVATAQKASEMRHAKLAGSRRKNVWTRLHWIKYVPIFQV